MELFERSVDAFLHEDEPASAAQGPASGSHGPASGAAGPASGAAVRAGEGAEEGEGEVLKDLLVKLVRLLAHLAISPGSEPCADSEGADRHLETLRGINNFHKQTRPCRLILQGS